MAEENGTQPEWHKMKNEENIESLIDLSFELTEEYINFCLYGHYINFLLFGYSETNKNIQKTKPYVFNKKDKQNDK